ncbi:hypothetical protein [Microcystis phage Mae-JY35]
MITARSNSALGFWCRQVASMKPGERLDVSMHDLSDILSFEHNDATFTPADRILGNIVGSAYTHSFRVNPERRTVTFMRHEDTGERRYKDPDHDIRLARLQDRQP